MKRFRGVKLLRGGQTTMGRSKRKRRRIMKKIMTIMTICYVWYKLKIKH